MSTIIYLYNSQIQIAVGKTSSSPGKVRLNNIYTFTAPEGSIINGVITDIDALRTGLMSFINMNQIPVKDTIVLIESSKISGKLIEVPKLNEHKTLEFCIREFADTGRTREDSTFCYTELRPSGDSKLRKVFAEAIPKEMLRDIADLFKPMGINLKGVYSHEGKILNMLDVTVARRFKSFSVHMINDNNMSNFLWDNGSYDFHNGQRFFNAIGTNEFYDETSRYFRQIKQFMEVRSKEDHREMIFYTGVTEEEYKYYDRDNKEQGINHFSQVLDLNLTKNRELHDKANIAICAVSGLFETHRMSDFIVNSKAEASSKKDSDQAFIIKSAILTAIIFAVLLIGAIVSILFKAGAKTSFFTLYDYNNSPAMLDQLKQYDETMEENAKLSGQLYAIDKVREDVATYPVATDDVISIIRVCAAGYASVEITGFDAEAGSLDLTAKAAEVDMIKEYIYRLMDEKIFSDVHYTGYHFDESTQLWNIDVTCTLAESAGR